MLKFIIPLSFFLISSFSSLAQSVVKDWCLPKNKYQRNIPFHKLVEGLGGYGELVEKSSEIIPAVERAIKSGKPSCINVKTKGVISPIVAATSDKRDKASIE